MCMGVKEPSQEQEAEQLSQHSRYLGQFVYNEKETLGVFSFHPLVLIYHFATGHGHRKCMKVFAHQ